MIILLEKLNFSCFVLGCSDYGGIEERKHVMTVLLRIL